MKYSRVLAVSMVAALVFISCEPLLLFEDTYPDFASPADKALCVVIRPLAPPSIPIPKIGPMGGGSINLGAKQALIYIDGKVSGGNIGKTVCAFEVEPGEHLIIAKADIPGKVKFNFQAGKIYYLMHNVFPVPIGVTTLVGSTLEPMPGDEAVAKLQEEKGNCKLVKYNPAAEAEDLEADDVQDEREKWDDWAKKEPDKAKIEMEYPGY